MAKATVNVSILFADIAGSSKLYERFGNDGAQRIIVDVLDALAEIACQHNGEALRTIGDEVMCAFGQADDAVVAAVAMHQIANSHQLKNNVESRGIGLYIRIDTGICIRDGLELFGEPVNSAANIKSLAKPNQTLLSERTRNELSVEIKSATRFIGNLPIKGKVGTFDIFEHVWEDVEITAISWPLYQVEDKSIALDIVNGAIAKTVDEMRPILTIGRLSENDLVLNYPHISRMHAKIEYRLGRFIFADFSINGTYVHILGRGNIFVKHDELPLDGKGLICPGRKVSFRSSDAIHFIVRS
jgi:class 3 adenylate cyclase